MGFLSVRGLTWAAVILALAACGRERAQPPTPTGVAAATSIDFAHVADHSAARARLGDLIGPGDTVLIKGSNSVGLSHLVTALTNGESGFKPSTSANEV